MRRDGGSAILAGMDGSVRSQLEHEAQRVAEQELCRRRVVLASLSPADRESVAIVAHRVASRLAGYLAAEADREQRLGRAPVGCL